VELVARLQAVAPARPDTVGIRDWVTQLARDGLIDRKVAADVAAMYEAVRFGGETPSAESLRSLRGAVDAAIACMPAVERSAPKGTADEAKQPGNDAGGHAPGASAPVGDAPSTDGAERVTSARPTARASARLRPQRAAWKIGAALAAVALLLSGGYLALEGRHQAGVEGGAGVGSTAPTEAPGATLFTRRIDLSQHDGTGRGVSWVDFDRDGDQDLFLSSDSRMRLLETRGGAFIDVTARMGLSGAARSGQWADYDRDGDLDLAVTATGRVPVVWKRGDATFEPQQLPVRGWVNPEGLGWLDMERDGDADLIVTNGRAGIHLFRNDAGDLVDASDAVGFGAAGIGRVNGDFVHLADFDGDGFVDLLYGARRGLAARNVAGQRFEDVEWPLDLRMEAADRKRAPAVGDFDGDSDPDLFIPQDPGVLHINGGSGRFSPVAHPELAAHLTGGANSGVFGDLDRDGDVDLIVALKAGGLVLFTQAEGNLNLASAATGLPTLMRGVIVVGLSVADWESDGDLDIAYHGMSGQVGVLVNEAPLPSGYGTLAVDFAAPQPPGTQLVARSSAVPWVQTRRLGAAINVGSQSTGTHVFSMPAGIARLAVLRSDGVRLCGSATIAPGVSVTIAADDPSEMTPCERERVPLH